MHDCLQARERLIDLVFAELDCDQELRLMAEIELCADCLGQYRSMRETLAVFDQTAEASLPQESFWSEFEEVLRRQIASAPHKQMNASPLWRRALTASVRVPLPIAAAIALLLLTSSLLAVRNLRPSTPQVRVTETVGQTRIVEIPVVQERVVTRTVFVTPQSRQVRRQLGASSASEVKNIATHRPQNVTANSAGASLEGFKPADDVKITIIKGNHSNEK